MTKARKSSKKDKKAKKAKGKATVAVIVPPNVPTQPKIPKFVPHFTDSEDENPTKETVKAESELLERPQPVILPTDPSLDVG